MQNYIVTAKFPVEAASPEAAARQVRDAFGLTHLALLVRHEDGSPIGEFDEDETMIIPPLTESWIIPPPTES